MKTLIYKTRQRLPFLALMAAATIATGPGFARAQSPALPGRSVEIRASDGVVLGGELLLPGDSLPPHSEAATEQAFPTILKMTPYGPGRYWSQYLGDGYAHLNVDVRGTGDSEGVMCLLCDREAEDVYDVVEWIAAQPWSDGNVGMIGESYEAGLQLVGAAKQPPHLRAIVPTYAPADVFRDLVWHNGMYALTFSTLFLATNALNYSGASGVPDLARLGNPQLILETRTRPWDDPWYRERSAYPKYDDITVPVLHRGGWFDIMHRGGLDNFNGVASQHNRIIQDPCTHHGCGVNENTLTADPLSEYAADALPPGPDPVLAWYDRFLKGENNGADEESPVMYYDLGSKEWLTAETWPPEGSAQEIYYLSATPSGSGVSLNDGSLVESSPSRNGSDMYLYDPSTGLADLLSPQGAAVYLPHIRLDQRIDEVRSLTYTTPLMESPMSLAGPIELHFWGSTTASEMDWVVKVTDVAPSGESKLLTRGFVRASHRRWDESRSVVGRPFLPNDQSSPVPTGKELEYRVDVRDIAHTVKAGHHLRIMVNSADTPWHEPFTETALNAIFHGPRYPSRLILTVSR